MRSIAIVGAGQAGLQLGIGLVQSGYAVKIFTNRTAEQVLNGKIMSSQGMFNSALQGERNIGIDFWQDKTPQNNSVKCTTIGPQKSNYLCHWQGKTTNCFQSIDQRIKFPRWMKEFERIGGELIIDNIDKDRLNEIAKHHDLTIVATGKSDISQLFPRNHELSIFDKPQRILSCLYLQNLTPENPAGLKAYLIPGVGEFFSIQGLTFSGLCEMMLFEGIPGGDFDCWADVKNIREQFNVALNLLKKFIPYEAERWENAMPTDNNASLIGSYAPIVRYPISKMPCGKLITAIGDCVILNDPNAGQGANGASKFASHYLRKIIGHGQNEFSEEWMNETFEEYWNQDGKWATEWSNLLLQPPKQHIIELLFAAGKNSEIANKLANGFDQPSTLFPWVSNAEQTHHFIRSCENTEMNDE